MPLGELFSIRAFVVSWHLSMWLRTNWKESCLTCNMANGLSRILTSRQALVSLNFSLFLVCKINGDTDRINSRTIFLLVFLLLLHSLSGERDAHTNTQWYNLATPFTKMFRQEQCKCWRESIKYYLSERLTVQWYQKSFRGFIESSEFPRSKILLEGVKSI